ncbi:LacI family DNA-binding transcriptional regulator [Microbispora bryophytorum]|uniref:LacI family transcriptional regulator n=2 Tax=Microbispora bryophytorum TaxID=1460882 RepID=A0A8H9H0E6_9ACTN|nr:MULTISPECIES: LacI family DNA-binding transcriptional regulator [Microbispora]MBD3137120.1 LacI family DNA-binding transcriptional regulator [Microbispora bryophytorum]MBD3148453.1 LacI family DNA-binding transcriptional regulator [Microbispora camponoti]TQS07364.1 LacI family transcriptional regulator [Microbispora bryophytorum]GGO14555.1 LacI family transcriptional regulator [Microbispora bryophytorum]
MTTTREPTPPDRIPSRPLTIAQLAELAGVSPATVSKVVNGRSEVAPETRALVEDLIREHGYRRQKKRPTAAPLIELVFNELEGGYAMEVIKGVEQVAREHGLAVVVSELQDHHPPAKGWIEGVIGRRPHGVIVVFSGLTRAQYGQLRTRDIPVVLVDPTGDPGHKMPSVGAGNWSGGLSAARHLLELGHRRIALITGPADALSSRARLDGFRAAMDTAGVPTDPELVRQGDFSAEDGLEHARSLLALPQPPTAVFAFNDAQAMGVYQAAHERGLRIPDELSVVGFDDLPMAQWLIPALTTVRQPLTEMAAAATTMVVAIARGDSPPQNRLELTTGLVVRGSTAPLVA